MWYTFQGGETVGESGSEEGTIVLDEEFEASARMTLERDSRIAPFAITCGMYGWFVHTRFFSSDGEARDEYAKMRTELARVASLRAGATQDAVAAALSNFVKQFP